MSLSGDETRVIQMVNETVKSKEASEVHRNSTVTKESMAVTRYCEVGQSKNA